MASSSAGPPGSDGAAANNLVALLTSQSAVASTARTALVAAIAAGAVYFGVSRQQQTPSPPPPPTTDAPRPPPRIHAGDDTAAQHVHKRLPNVPVPDAGPTRTDQAGKNCVAIFWDVDNCAPPNGSSGRSVALAIRNAVRSIGTAPTADAASALHASGPIISFKAYLELSSEAATSSSQVALRSELQGSGVTLIDTPKSGRKDVADKMMITDLLSFAIDVPPPARIALLSGDRDFAYPLGILRNRGYEVLLITPPVGATPILEASANAVLRWRQDVLGLERDANGRPYANGKSGGGSGAKNGATPSTPVRAGTAAAAASVATSAGRTAAAAAAAATTPSAQAPTPAVALRGPGAAPVPPVFQPLVALLEQMRSEGVRKPLRSAVADRLAAGNKDIYEKAGASRWAEYAAVAEAAGVITLGNNGVPGTEWVCLRSVASPDQLRPLSKSAAKINTQLPNGADLRAFYPLIEVVKEFRASGNPRPLASLVASQLMAMQRQGIVDAYARAGVRNFKEYMALADAAKVARCVETGSAEGVHYVEVHPKYAELHTGQMTGGSVTKMIDTAGAVREAAQDVGRAREDLPSKASKLASPVKAISSLLPKSRNAAASALAEDGQGAEGGDSTHGGSGAKLLPHNPSGQLIHPTYFPLANLLTVQRSEGKYYSSDSFIHRILSNHQIIGPRIRTSQQFAAYLERASRDDIVTIEPGFKPGVLHVRLSPRLCVESAPMLRAATPAGPPDDAAAAAAPAATTAAASASVAPPKLKLLAPASTSAPTASDRQKFKPLLDTLVAMRRETTSDDAASSAVVVGKGRLAAEMVRRHPLADTPAGGAPGAWFQAHGASGVGDYLADAQAKGFVELLGVAAAGDDDDDGGAAAADGGASGVGTAGRVYARLSSKYREMFFPGTTA